MEKYKIGFVGTGVMGSGMVANLLKGGCEVAVYNRTKEKAQPLVEKGATWMPSVAELAAASDIIITIVGYPKDVESVYFGPDGILENAHAGSYIIDMTTSSPKLAQKIYQGAKEKGIYALDAPVSGGDVGAKNGTLCIMVGGDEEAFNKLLPVFSMMGTTVMLEGKAGLGQQCKMCNQICIATNLIGVCESLIYAKNAGLDREKVLKILEAGGAASWQLSAYTPRIFKGDFNPGFYVKHLLKDIRIALDEAKSAGLNLPALTLAEERFNKLSQENMDELGTHALYKLYEENK